MSNEQNDFLKTHAIGVVAQIVAAYLGRQVVTAADLQTVIRDTHATITSLAAGNAAPKASATEPAVSIKKSIGDDFIICLEDGKKLKMLKRYLRTKYDMTPEQYRAKWHLPSNYPMVAPAYARQRSEFAKSIGLGRSAPAKKKRAP